MNWNEVETKWSEVRGRIREKWSRLTHDDLERMKGEREAIALRIQRRYGMPRERAQRAVDELIRGL